MNPETNKFEELKMLLGEEGARKRLKEEGEETTNLRNQFKEMLQAQQVESLGKLVRPDGTPVPKHWSVFTVGEDVVIKNYTFRVAYIGETSILFEPVGPVVVGDDDE